ncbi:diphthamide synthesis protein [Candidatus Altiarchaeota archaeon]
MKTLFIPCHHKADPVKVLDDNKGMLDGLDTICLVSTAQHTGRIEAVGQYLKDIDKTVVIGGQILGCNRQSAMSKGDDADCFLFLGSGRFHPIALAAESGRPVFILNPLSAVLDRISAEEVGSMKRKKRARLSRAAGAKSFGILVSLKDGQCDLERAEEVRKKLESLGFKAYVLAGDELSPDKLMGFGVDCLVNTSCPRMVEDDYCVPIINACELSLIF